MPRQLISSDRLYSATPYHDAAIGTGRALAFTAGACPLDGDGQIEPSGDLRGQTRRALANLRIALEDAGCRPEDVVKTTVFVATTSRDDLLAAWEEYVQVHGDNGPPSTLLGVSVLGYPGQLVEIEAVAVRD